VPVLLTINKVYEEPKRFLFHMAYHKFAPQALSQLLRPTIWQLPNDSEGSEMEVTIRLIKPAGVIRFVDSYSTAIPTLQDLLERLIKQERKEDLEIESVDIQYVPVKRQDYWQPVNINLKGKGKRSVLSVIAQRARDNQISQITERIDARPVKGFKKKRLQWWDGWNLQSYVLARIPVRDAFEFLAQFERRESLYLIYAETIDDMLARGKEPTEKWKQRPLDLQILLTPKLDGAHFFLAPDSNNTVHAVEFKDR
jgi:hypothetical protein